MTTPLDRLLLEAIPTPPPPPRTPAAPWTPAEQDAHWNALCQAVDTPGTPRPRLRLLPPPEPAENLTADRPAAITP